MWGCAPPTREECRALWGCIEGRTPRLHRGQGARRWTETRMRIPQRLIKLHAQHSQPQLWQEKEKERRARFQCLDHHRRFLQLEHRNFLLYFKIFCKNAWLFLGELHGQGVEALSAGPPRPRQPVSSIDFFSLNTRTRSFRLRSAQRSVIVS